MRYQVNNNPRVIESQVEMIMSGDLADPTVSTLGSRIEAVARFDALYAERGKPRASTKLLAEILGVTPRTIERYRQRLRLYSLE